jgi:predicted dehydrogenase
MEGMMKGGYFLVCGLCLLAACAGERRERPGDGDVRLITLDPGHFHAALVQKTSYPQVCDEVFVYAPVGADVDEHLKKIDAFNGRADSPTRWRETVYTGPDFEERMLEEKKGNVVVLAGNNGKKTGYIRRAVGAGLHVLADKPMAISVADFAELEECFGMAEKKGVLLYDIMTERFEIASMLQRAFAGIEAVYGEQIAGTADDPAVTKESVHHFFKAVAGTALKRPAWFFDTAQQGEGIVDVTTHLVDLVQWACFPGEIIRYAEDVELIDANRWPTALTAAQFAEVTGLTAYPDFLTKDVRGDTLRVYANGDITYRIRGVCAKVSVRWNYTYPAGGGDTHYSVMKGSRAHLVIEQGEAQGYKPVLYVRAVEGTDAAAYEKTLSDAVATVAEQFPGIGLRRLTGAAWEVTVPEKYHNGHEAHFGQVTERFLAYLQQGILPDWEIPNMLAKYYVTTRALEMAGRK